MSWQNPSQEFVYLRTYARYLESEGRRESWPETVNRVIEFLKTERQNVPAKVWLKLEKYMLNLDVLPSMRLVWAAGEAARRCNVSMYNCSFVAIRDIPAFSEMLYVLMCGTGVGFSVQTADVEQLPEVPKFPLQPDLIKHSVEDSKEGWANSLKLLLEHLYQGKLVDFDYSGVRPKGARLQVMGGRASGPEPLILLHKFVTDLFHSAQGRKLKPIEVHDICNKVAEIVVVGGVRRSSQISLSDLNDEEMRHAKDWPCPLHRFMANNSAVYLSKPSGIDFMREWHSLAASGSGERGIFNLGSVRATAPKRRDTSLIEGTNPCGEIALRDKQFCNLSTVIVRPNDTLTSLLDKVETAAWVGTIQASFTHFPYLRKEWAENCRDEALLGVSLSGQMDNVQLLTKQTLTELKRKAVDTNKHAADLLGIKQAAAVSCGKPEGTTSQLTFSGSGCHPWYSEYFIRRYRISSTDPLCQLLRDAGAPLVPEVGQTWETASTLVVEFPCRAPAGAVLRSQVSAIDQLKWYKRVQTNWCEHNQSITIYVKPEEWFEVGNWVYRNWNLACGLSFLPYDGGHYQLAPYEEIGQAEYQERLARFPKLDYSQLWKYEVGDQTEGAKTYACVGDNCELS